MTLRALSPVTADDEHRRRALWLVPTPLAVLGTVDGTAPHLMNVSWVTPVSATPLAVVVSVEAASRTRSLLDDAGVTALSLLTLEQRELGRAFVKPELTIETTALGESVQGHEIARSQHGAPFLVLAAAVLAGPVRRLETVGDHVVYVIDVAELAIDERALVGAASARAVRALSIQDTRMNYGR